MESGTMHGQEVANCYYNMCNIHVWCGYNVMYNEGGGGGGGGGGVVPFNKVSLKLLLKTWQLCSWNKGTCRA